MIRVLHIVLGLQVGGLEKFVLGLVENYSSNVKSFIVCLEIKGSLGDQCDHLDIIELNKKAGLDLGIVPRLVFLARELDVDIIHTHNPGPHFYGAITGLITRIPVLHTKHGRNYPTDKKKIWLNRISSFLSRKIVAVSSNAAEVSLKVENISTSKVTVILNGIDTKKFHPTERKIGEGAGRLIRLGIVARLSKEKDHQTLLAACKILANCNLNFHLDIIGDGPLRDILENAVRDLGIEAFVSFTGMRHDIFELLQCLDVFVLSSTTEGISLTLLEAMATGLPVVSTNVGGNPEVVLDGETGYLVPPQDPKEMASKLLLLANDENLRKQMGAKGCQRVSDQFSINKTASAYEKLYRSLR